MERYKVKEIQDHEGHIHLIAKNKKYQIDKSVSPFYKEKIKVGDKIKEHIDRDGLPIALSSNGYMILDFDLSDYHIAQEFIDTIDGINYWKFNKLHFNIDVARALCKKKNNSDIIQCSKSGFVK